MLNFGFFKALAFTDVFAIYKISPIYVDDIVYFFLKFFKKLLIDLKEKYRSIYFLDSLMLAN